MVKIKGLGDIVELITRYTGIKWVVKKIWDKGCGCDERQEVLNKIVPLKKPDIYIRPPMMPPIPTKKEKK